MRCPGLVATQTRMFLFADVEGSAAMRRRLGGGYAGVLADHYRLIRAGLAARGGGEAAVRGDGVFAMLAAPRACVDAAIGVQRAVVSDGWPTGAGLIDLGWHR